MEHREYLRELELLLINLHLDIIKVSKTNQVKDVEVECADV